jgi:predicted ATP-dependent serine protease
MSEKKSKYVVNQEVDPKMFERFPTGKEIDSLFSDEGGLMRATITMIIGDPGVGKTTINNDMLADIIEKHPGVQVLFISSEESFIDRTYNQRKSPKTNKIPTLFLGAEENRKAALEEAFKEGWDIILVDSFKDVQDKVNMELEDATMAEAEAWLLDLMVRTSQGDNDQKIYTAFLCIQQVTKGRDFVGSNSLKHNTTAMMEMRFSKEYEGLRYVEFTKNRRCGSKVGTKLYYTFNEEKQELVYSKEPIVPAAQERKGNIDGPTVLPNKIYTLTELFSFLPGHLTFKEKEKVVTKMRDQMLSGKPIVVPEFKIS